jgi:flagellar motor switch protein FliG
LSDLVDFEDLGLLDGRDLRAVLEQVSDSQVGEALVGTPPGLRQSLLIKLTPAFASRLEARVQAQDPVPFEAVQSAQRAVVEALCRLSRGGQVAFDDPADMMVA